MVATKGASFNSNIHFLQSYFSCETKGNYRFALFPSVSLLHLYMYTSSLTVKLLLFAGPFFLQGNFPEYIHEILFSRFAISLSITLTLEIIG